MSSVCNMADIWYPQQVQYTQSNALRQRVVKSSRLSGKKYLSVTSDENLHAYLDLRCSYVQKGQKLIDCCANPN
jgi:hypothetical protein